MSLVQINWNPDRRELRSFGLVILSGFTAFAALLYFRHHPVPAVTCLAIGGVVGSLAVSGLRLAILPYRAWMGIAFVAGNVMSRVLLAVVYYILITPMAIVMRLTSRDKLALRPRRSDSYWAPLPPPTAARYERQY